MTTDSIGPADRADDIPAALVLVSFDIDGTMEAGEPPGPVTFAMVAEAKSRGYIVGSASDRTLSEQRAIWAAVVIPSPSFRSPAYGT